MTTTLSRALAVGLALALGACGGSDSKTGTGTGSGNGGNGTGTTDGGTGGTGGTGTDGTGVDATFGTCSYTLSGAATGQYPCFVYLSKGYSSGGTTDPNRGGFWLVSDNPSSSTNPTVLAAIEFTNLPGNGTYALSDAGIMASSGVTIVSGDSTKMWSASKSSSATTGSASITITNETQLAAPYQGYTVYKVSGTMTATLKQVLGGATDLTINARFN